MNAAAFAGPLLLVVAWVKFYEGRKIITLGFRSPGKGVKMLLLGVVAGVGMLSLPVLFLWAIGAYEVVGGPTGSITGAEVLPLLVLLAVFVLLQSGTEEIITRGFLLQNSVLKLPARWAVPVPALGFTLIHGVLFDPLPFATIFLFGMMASFLTLRLSALWLAIGIHAGWNFAQGNLYGISVSGLPPDAASLLFFKPAEGAPVWLTGGSFGVEASLLAVIVLLVAAVIAYVSFRRYKPSVAGREIEEADPKTTNKS